MKGFLLKLCGSIMKISRIVKISLLFMLLLIIYISVAKIDVVSPGTGVITGSNDKVDIISPDSGFINFSNLKSGAEIHRGDILFSYVNLDFFYKEKSLRELVKFSGAMIKKIDHNISLLIKLLSQEDLSDTSIDHYINSDPELSAYKFYHEKLVINVEEKNLILRKEAISESITNLKQQHTILAYRENLLKKSGSPEVEILNNKAEMSKVESLIIDQQINLLTLESNIEKEKNNFKTNLLNQIILESNELNNSRKEQIRNSWDLELLKNKIKSNSVTSPVDGVVLDVTRTLTEGSYVEASQVIVRLKKHNVDQIIEAQFSAKYRPFLFDNAKVKIVINSPGYKRYFNGYIHKISADSFVNKNAPEAERYYKIEVRYDKEDSLISEYTEGVQVNVFAISRKMTILSYLSSLVNSNIVFNVW